MSTTPPDRPTERLRPSPAPGYDERGGDPNLVLLRLEQTLGSLRTGLMVVGVIAVAALGVAVYALMQANDDGGGGESSSGAASNERVSGLDDRIDRLSRQIQDTRSGGETGGDVADRVEALERTAKTLAERPSTDPQEAIDQLSGRIDDVAKDVEALQQSQPAP
jgi:hypothetical protein